MSHGTACSAVEPGFDLCIGLRLGTGDGACLPVLGLELHVGLRSA